MLSFFHNYTFRVFFLIVFALNPFIYSQSQGMYPVNPIANGYFEPHFGIRAESYFSAEDIFVSFGMGMDDLGWDYSASLNFGFRPYFKKVLIKEAEALYYQFREKLYFLSIDLEKRFFFLEYEGEKKLGIYTQGKFGYLFGDYRGYSGGVNSRFLISPSAGAVWQAKNVRIGLGYLHLETSDQSSPNHIELKLNFFLNKPEK
ncbi:MAG: hypothetical protein R3277_13085 [Brumimicrobium sp.]|nr:hypothetical protein [Brumimicrobium sp.]